MIIDLLYHSNQQLLIFEFKLTNTQDFLSRSQTMRNMISYSTIPKQYASNIPKWSNLHRNQQTQRNCLKIDTSSETIHDPEHISFGSNTKIKCKNNYKSYQESDQSPPTQLFTKLKMQKYQQAKQPLKQKDAKFIFSSLKQTRQSQQSKYYSIQNNQYENEQQQYGSSSKMKLNPDQIQSLEILKYDKVNHIVRQHIFKGRDVKQILENDILEYLQQEIQKILSHQRDTHLNDEILRKILKKSSKPPIKTEKEISINDSQNPYSWGQANSKNLQSTAQYWEKSDQKSIQQNKSNYYKRSQWKQNNFEKDEKNIKNYQSTIKNLKSLNSGGQKIDHLSSHKSEEIEKFETLNRNKKNMIQGANVVQFTLGECQGDEEDSENFTERQFQINIIESIHNFNTSGRFAKVEELRKDILNEQTDIDKFEYERMGKKRSNVQLNGDHRVLAFNRRRVPKGRAIKNKVMGNIILSQDQQQKI